MPETFDYTLPPTPEHYLNGAYALTGYHCKTAPRQYSPLLCLYLPFLIALSAMVFLLLNNQARLSALLEECYLDQDTLDRITGISMNTVYIIAGCFVVFGIISRLFSRRPTVQAAARFIRSGRNRGSAGRRWTACKP